MEERGKIAEVGYLLINTELSHNHYLPLLGNETMMAPLPSW